MLRTQGDGLAEQGAGASWGRHGLPGGPCRLDHVDSLGVPVAAQGPPLSGWPVSLDKKGIQGSWAGAVGPAPLP